MATSTKKSIVVIGGSYGGLSVAHHILKHSIPGLPGNNSYEVALVSSSSKVLCRPACPRAMIADSMFNQDKLFVDIAEQFKQYSSTNFRFVHGTATAIDTTARIVSTRLQSGATETINYYALVIATGAAATSPLHGLNADATDLKAHWEAFRKVLPKARNIVVAGGGPTGVETAGELGEYLNGRAGWFSSMLENPKVPITLVSGGARLLPQLREQLAEKAEINLAQVGVSIIKNVKVQSVAPEDSGVAIDHLATPTTINLSDGQALQADIFIPAYGTRPNTSFIPSHILAADGRVSTNPTTLRVEEAGPRVYALGDASSAARPAVHAILEQVPVLGSNIKRDLLLDSSAKSQAAPKDAEFKEDLRETQLVPIGKSKGVGAMMGYKLPSFLVWAIKGRDYWLWTTGRLWNGKQWA